MDINIREYQQKDYNACCSLQGELALHYAEIYGDPSISGDEVI
jgi:hypothetical protein